MSEKSFSPRANEDYELVQSAVDKGDQMAYAKLMTRYRDAIFFMVLKMVHNRDDAEDLTIEAFGKAFASLESYSPSFAFSTWLFKIATNNTIDFIRKKKLETLSIDEPIETDKGEDYSYDLQSENLDPEERFIKEQRAELMRNILERLSPKYKMLIELRYFEELSYDEIAKRLGLPLGTVKAQLYRAKELLFNILKKKKEKY